MRKAIVVDSNDIKMMLAEKYNVPEKNVLQAKYSYTIILETEDAENRVDQEA